MRLRQFWRYFLGQEVDTGDVQLCNAKNNDITGKRKQRDKSTTLYTHAYLSTSNSRYCSITKLDKTHMEYTSVNMTTIYVPF